MILSTSSTYVLASKVKQNLRVEATQKDMDLRRLVLQANMLDTMIETINTHKPRRLRVSFESLPVYTHEEFESEFDSDSDSDEDSDDEMIDEEYTWGTSKPAKKTAYPRTKVEHFTEEAGWQVAEEEDEYNSDDSVSELESDNDTSSDSDSDSDFEIEELGPQTRIETIEGTKVRESYMVVEPQVAA